MEYTEQEQEKMYKAYERVRVEGRFNMFSREAILCTGLTRKKYIYVMENYSELKNKFGGGN